MSLLHLPSHPSDWPNKDESNSFYFFSYFHTRLASVQSCHPNQIKSNQNQISQPLHHQQSSGNTAVQSVGLP
jgi:hypothetical protein